MEEDDDGFEGEEPPDFLKSGVVVKRENEPHEMGSGDQLKKKDWSPLYEVCPWEDPEQMQEMLLIWVALPAGISPDQKKKGEGGKTIWAKVINNG